ncbi:hypothetical protein CABS01_15571 [Colletotrichum abscissum]|uniref:Uncharacterized protein n=1 Tax=Colletotrichum abscissum TaxID=1671311 RepID=A0A9P9X132_9PEZI|nr:uncharacterized protein CABS01_15571 [Colletotrichum abscissum]KAI3530356.1 hypothetical protein CABS02_14541 [Colletotrichum abscissum]KAK1475865.1 hypothetical protein CABS01_15571 [Colletotrichum abscissum]
MDDDGREPDNLSDRHAKTEKTLDPVESYASLRLNPPCYLPTVYALRSHGSTSSKFGLLPPTQLSITNTTPRRAPFASHAIPLRVPADRLDLPVGTACLHLKLLGALQTSDGPSFGAKSQRLPEPHHSTVRPWCPARNSLNSTLALVFAFAICLGPHLCRRRAKSPSVFVSIIIKRTQSECDVAHKVQRQSSAESAWRIPNAVLVAKDVVISIITKGFQPVFLRRINHAAGVWSSASVSQDDFSSYFVSTARNIRLVKLSLSVGSSNIRKICSVYAVAVT